MTARTNCWEYMGCGREPDGRHETQDILKNRHLDIAGATHIGLNRKTNQDRYLICLDTGTDPTPRAAHNLVRLALDAGGTDNITVVVAQTIPPPKG